MNRGALLLAALLLPSCSEFVQYTGALSDSRTGRTLFVTVPATLGGFTGFVVGLPLDVVALPISYPVYKVQESQAPEAADPLSTMMFPSFLLWRVGALIAVPFDAVEYAVYRAWRPADTMTADERQAFEYEKDQELLERYPVEPIYPKKGS